MILINLSKEETQDLLIKSKEQLLPTVSTLQSHHPNQVNSHLLRHLRYSMLWTCNVLISANVLVPSEQLYA